MKYKINDIVLLNNDIKLKIIEIGEISLYYVVVYLTESRRTYIDSEYLDYNSYLIDIKYLRKEKLNKLYEI